ncbi:RecQ family ATP-dependent DNA helicase [Halobacillus rhizosphaerae]|uniref:RecQ family ATP-dependent DNA helicase n=1 Tax=Halobacillus rhizosphaerae TaxID=3064889 RepID=UPI00398A787C
MLNHNLAHYLEFYFGYTEFREGQKPIIEKVLAGEDVLGILPTGTGKSLCYQLPAKILPGTTLVVSPLISLMVDQVKQLKATGYNSVVALNSFMDRQERQDVFHHLEKYKLVYLSPEMLQYAPIRKQLSRLNISLFVIDEAHCISQWGHEFRTDYLKLSNSIKELGSPSVLALSATATPEVQADIAAQLEKPGMEKMVYPMDKQNISFSVEHYKLPEEKTKRIIEVLRNNQAPAMIYFSSRQWAEKVSFELQKELPHRIAFYHGGMDQTDRLLIQQQFMNNQLDVICCTSAFGMGVDKSDIRLVIHFHVPTQIESFIQEAGRAGRDGEPCASLVLFTPKDYQLPQMLIHSELPETEDLHRIFRVLFNYKQQNRSLREDELMEHLQLSESQWNFIKYQLERQNLLSSGTFTGTGEDWYQGEEEVAVFLEERWTYKQNKLNEMMQWVHHDGCRRDQLYLPFQSFTRTPAVPCCDDCGFDIMNFHIPSYKKEVFTGSWQERLNLIFQQGTNHEIF